MGIVNALIFEEQNKYQVYYLLLSLKSNSLHHCCYERIKGNIFLYNKHVHLNTATDTRPLFLFSKKRFTRHLVNNRSWTGILINKSH